MEFSATHNAAKKTLIFLLTRDSVALSSPVGPRPDDTAGVAVGGGDELDLLVDPSAAVVVDVTRRRRHEAGRRGGVRRVEGGAEGVDGYLQRSLFVFSLP